MKIKITILIISLAFQTLSLRSSAQCVSSPSFGGGAITESFERMAVNANNPAWFGGWTTPVTPFTFSSGLVLTLPNPNPTGNIIVGDWARGPVFFGICRSSVSSLANVPGGTAYMGINNGTGVIRLTFPVACTKVGFYVEGCPNVPLLMNVYNASNILIGSCSRTMTGLVGNWNTTFVGFNSSSGDIAYIDVSGYFPVIDLVTFEAGCVSPTISCPANITVNNTPGECGANVSYAATTTGTSPMITYSPPSGSFFPIGTTIVTATATSSCGTASCTFTVTVTDNENPTISCPAPIAVNNDLGFCGALVSYTVTSADNCPGQVVTQTGGLASGNVFPVGVTTNSFLVTDASGSTATCSFTVTVTDDEAPAISVSDVLTCYADNNFGCNVSLGATATDNCGVLSLTSDAPGCFPVGTTVVTWTATDIHGNVSTATQLVTRNPEINIDICAGITRTIYTGTVNGAGPFGPQSINLTSTVTGGTPGYTYSWSGAGLNFYNIANPVASPAITTTYTLTVTDSKGCTRSLSITINVLPLSSAVCSGSGNNVKFSVCHIPPGNPSNPQNICISVNALNAHLTSGSNGHNNCYLGPCGQQLCFSTVPGAANLVQTKGADEEQTIVTPVIVVEEPTDAFKVHVYPNPSAGEFSLKVISKSAEPIRVRIMDMNGEVKSVSIVVSKTNLINVGAKLLNGTYMAEVTQGENRQVIKLVKVN